MSKWIVKDATNFLRKVEVEAYDFEAQGESIVFYDTIGNTTIRSNVAVFPSRLFIVTKINKDEKHK